MIEERKEDEGLGASSLRADRVTDAAHEAGKPSSPPGSVPTGAPPGPWLTYRANFRTLVTVPVRSGGFRCMVIDKAAADVVAEARGRTEAEAQANARLIAAAPDLYEALTKAREWIAEDDCAGFGPAEMAVHARLVSKIDAALAKARGES